MVSLGSLGKGWQKLRWLDRRIDAFYPDPTGFEEHTTLGMYSVVTLSKNILCVEWLWYLLAEDFAANQWSPTESLRKV